MLEVLSAFVKAARDVVRPDILWHALWPPLLSLLAWVFAAVAVWDRALAFVSGLLPSFAWSGWEWIAHWTSVFLLVAAFGALAYATALLLVAVVALPHMLSRVAAREYPDVMRHGDNAFWGSLRNTLTSGAMFLGGWLASLPLLLVPGVVLVLPLLWTAWLNQRTFRFDALAEHATRSELDTIIAAGRHRFYVAGIGTALLAHIPVVNLLAPAYAALVFMHLGLAELRRLRREKGVEL